MDNNRNWQGWAALLLAGLALVVALIGRNPSGPVTITLGPGPQAPQAQAAPWPPQAQAAPNAPQGPSAWHDGRDAGPGDHFGRAAGPHGGFANGPHGHRFPFFLPFMLIGGLIKLAGIALIVWLLTRFFRSRRDRPQPPTSPTPGAA